MHLLSRWSIITICILGLLLGSLCATLGRGTPAVAATPSGAAYAWGSNTDGQLGNGTTNGTTNDSSVPVAVSLPAGMTPVALGTGPEPDHSLAILSSSAPTAAILSGFRGVHTGGAIRFHWRVASAAGLRGFFLTAGTHRLDRRLIAVDAHRQSYAYRSRWQGHGHYLLHGVLQGGAVVTLAGAG